MVMYKKILVPLDGSELAEKALSFAEEEAKAHGASLVLLRVVQLMFQEEPISQAEQEAIQLSKDKAGAYLEEVAERLRKDGVDVKLDVVDGDPANVILNVAEAENVDLIAMTTHGYSGLERFVWGSVADKVAKATNKPLLLVRAIPMVITAIEATEKVGA
jgi:nucleotide-binding universal stress UspA family protein